MEKVKTLLKEFTKVEGVIVSALVSFDGFLIDGIGPQDVDLEDMAVAASTAFGLGNRLGENIKGGEINQIMLEYNKRSVIVSKLPDVDVILFIVGEDNSNLGAIRYSIKKHGIELSKTL